MAFLSGFRKREQEGYHVRIGDVYYVLDESGTYGEPFRRWTQLPSQQQLSVSFTGERGASDLSDDLVWAISDFDGEGQKVLAPSDPDLVKRFYKSEGLDFRTPGEFKLNRSSILTKPPDAATSATTFQGEADCTDITGTSTAGSGSNDTDRRLNATGDEIKTSNSTPGNKDTTVDVYAYLDIDWDANGTTVQGSSFTPENGKARYSGTDLKSIDEPYPSYSDASASNIMGYYDITGLTAGTTFNIRAYTFADSADKKHKTTLFAQGLYSNNYTIPLATSVAEKRNTTTEVTHNLSFTVPSSGKVRIRVTGSQNGLTDNDLYLDKIQYMEAIAPNANSITVTVYNVTGAAVVTTQTVNLNTVSQGVKVIGLAFQAAAATEYRYQVKRNTPNSALGTTQSNKVWVDKVVETTTSSAGDTVSIESVHLGSQAKVWAIGSIGNDFATWVYNFSTESWDKNIQTTPAATGIRAFETTDAYEYLLVGTSIYNCTTAANNALITGIATGAVGMAITQDRIFVLTEDATNGVDVTTYALTGGASVATSGVQTAGITPDTTLRQRMCGTPNGARFFINHSGVAASVWECDASGEALATTQIASLPPGIKATAIAYTDGLTAIAGQVTTESGVTGPSGLWIIDQDGDISFAGYMRPSEPLAAPPIGIQFWENDIYILEAKRVWRYNLLRGGIFLEYELTPPDITKQRSIAVMKNHIFAAYSGTTGGVFVTGSNTDKYRTAGSESSNQYISSQYHMGIPYGKKALDSIDLLTTTMPANTSVKVEYQIDEDGTWTTAGIAFPGNASYHFSMPTGSDTVRFRYLSVRVTLVSETGAATPTVKAVVIRAHPVPNTDGGATGAGIKDYIDLLVRLEDEDSPDRPTGQMSSGYAQRRNVYEAYASGQRLTLLDGYDSKEEGVDTTYLVKIAALDDHRTQLGESTCLVRCQIL